jgi:hypothetical protein
MLTCMTALMVIKIVRNSGGLAASKGQMMSLVWLIVESAAIYTYVSKPLAPGPTPVVVLKIHRDLRSFSLCLMGLLISANSVSFIFGDMQSSIIVSIILEAYTTSPINHSSTSGYHLEPAHCPRRSQLRHLFQSSALEHPLAWEQLVPRCPHRRQH